MSPGIEVWERQGFHDSSRRTRAPGKMPDECVIWSTGLLHHVSDNRASVACREGRSVLTLPLVCAACGCRQTQFNELVKHTCADITQVCRWQFCLPMTRPFRMHTSWHGAATWAKPWKVYKVLKRWAYSAQMDFTAVVFQTSFFVDCVGLPNALFPQHNLQTGRVTVTRVLQCIYMHKWL